MDKNENSFNERIEETMLGPLWARAKYSKKYPELLDDQKAIEIIKQIDYNFSEIENYLGEWRGLGLMARAKNFDNALKNYIMRNPECSVVNIGAGLDTTFYRVDNGKIQWFDLDLPSAIKFRKSFLPESERNRYIAKSVFDFSWFKDIEFNIRKGCFFLAGGFVYYFQKEELATLFMKMAEEFSGAEIIFDTTSKLANKVINVRARKAGEQEVRFHFGVGNPEKVFPTWSSKIKIIDWYTIWSRATIIPNWDENVIKLIKRSERIKAAKIVHLKFQ